MRLFILGSFVFACVFGCSSESSGGGGGSCGTFSACGGDVVGTWKITAACGSAAASTSCPAETVTLDAQASGSVTFAADGTYGGSTTITGNEVLTLPISCTSSADCDALQTSVRKTSPMATCTGTTTCTCNVPLAPQTSSGSGTYKVSGNTLVITSSTGTPKTYDYCAQNGVLKLQTKSADGTTSMLVGTR